ncbi:MAG: TatD family hydrolase [Planctomycetia bacterium]|nr:TatD family hydrolase [Planctomycetia bacterium]
MNNYLLIDTHAHLYLDDFEENREALLERCQKGEFPEIQGKTINDPNHCFRLKAIIQPGISWETSQKVVEMAQSHDFLFAAIGVHPNYIQNISEDLWNQMDNLTQNNAVVGIGETGLDLYWNKSPLETQIDFLLRHIDLAQKKDLPVIIHCREAMKELLPILRQVRQSEKREVGSAVSSGISEDEFPLAIKERGRFPLRGVIHSFCEGPEVAQELVELGFYLGFGGSLTFTNKKFAEIGEAAKIVPEDRLLLETDSPFLTPHPFRGKLERNEPLMTAFVAKKLAELRKVSNEEMICQTTKNAQTLFRLPKE